MEEKMPSQPDSGFPTGRPELWCLGVSAVLGILLTNFLLFGGFRLGFALISAVLILFNGIFLLCRGHRLTPYSAALLILSLVICGSFARADGRWLPSASVSYKRARAKCSRSEKSTVLRSRLRRA